MFEIFLRQTQSLNWILKSEKTTKLCSVSSIYVSLLSSQIPIENYQAQIRICAQLILVFKVIVMSMLFFRN